MNYYLSVFIETLQYFSEYKETTMQKLLYKIITIAFIIFFTIFLIIDLKTNANTNQNRPDIVPSNNQNESSEKPGNSNDDINNYFEPEVYERIHK